MGVSRSEAKQTEQEPLLLPRDMESMIDHDSGKAVAPFTDYQSRGSEISKGPPYVSKRRALLVGICYNQCGGDDDDDMQPLIGPHNDIRAMERLLLGA
jgi:hypothetical protein